MDVAVLSVAEDTRDARFHRVVAALEAAGLVTTAVGVGDPGHLPTSTFATLANRPSIVRRIPRATKLAWQAPADILLTLDPAAALGAWPVARLRRKHLVVDVHEDYSSVMADRAWAHGLRGRLVRTAVAATTWAAARADLTIVADDHVPPTTARHRLVVRNIPDPEDMPSPSPRGGGPRAIYIGALSKSRGLDSMLSAVAAAPDWHLDLVGALGDRDDDALHIRIKDLGIADRVNWHGRLPPSQAWELAKGAWVGLALLKNTPAYRMAIPTKVYEYAMVGIPVLATDLPRMHQFIVDHGLGFTTHDAAGAASLLRRWARQPELLDPHAAAARTWRQGTTAESRPFVTLGSAVARLAGAASGQPRDDHRSDTASPAPKA